MGGELARRLARLEAAIGVSSAVSLEELARARELLPLAGTAAVEAFAAAITPPAARKVLRKLADVQLLSLSRGEDAGLSHEQRVAVALGQGNLTTALAALEADVLAGGASRERA